MHNHRNTFHDEAEANIKGLEQEIARMRHNLSAYGSRADASESSAETSDDIIDIFTEWRKLNGSASNQQHTEPVRNIRRTYESSQQYSVDYSEYLRPERRSQPQKRLKPVWVGVLLIVVLVLAGFGIVKLTDSQAIAQQDDTLTMVEKTTISAETIIAAGKTVPSEPEPSAANTTVAATAPEVTAAVTVTAPEATISSGGEVVAVANGNEKDPASSMVAIGKKLVYIDAGHGGNDHGCVYGGVSEKDVDLQISMLLGEALQDMGYEVAYTRDHDEYFSLSKRAKFANDYKADIFVSVHCNAYEDASVYGLDVYHNKVATADQLAEQVFNSLADKLDTRARSYTYGSYQVLRQSKMPGILIEMGFLSNAAEREKLCDEEYQALAADAIAAAVHEYFAAQEADKEE